MEVVMYIKKKLPIIMIILISIPLLILSYAIYNYTYMSVTNDSKNHIKQVTSIEGNALSTFVNYQIKEVELSARIGSVVELLKEAKQSEDLKQFIYKTDALNVDKLLTLRVKELNDVQHSFICDLKGNIIADSNSTGLMLNITDREYFQQAINGEIAISDEMKSKISNEDIIVVASPVIDEQGNVIGLYCNAIQISAFNKYIENITIGNTGYAYLVDDDGIMIAHPQKDKLGKPVENSVLRKVVDEKLYLNQNDTGFDTYVYNGTKKYFGYTVIPKINWILAVTQNVDEVNAPARLELYFIIVLTLIMLVITSIISLLFSKSITNPISSLIAMMNKAENGDLSVSCDYNSNNELGKLSSNFNSMIKKLSGSYEELSAVYEELSATEEELRCQYEELLENEKALTISEDRFKQALDGINDVIWEWDIKADTFFASDKWEELTGYSNKNIDIKKFLKIILPNEELQRIIKNYKTLTISAEYFREEFEITTKSGDKKWILNRARITRDSKGNPIKITGTISDVTNIRQANDKIMELAYCDSLTGIPNRTTLMRKLDEVINKCAENNKLGAALFIDLDDFKRINDSLGHDIGDKLLKRICTKAKNILNKNEILYRFGGDEFLVLMCDVKAREQVINLANRLLNIFKDYFIIDNKQVYITCSIGICIFPTDGKDKNSILKNADTAMYKAKEKGKNTFEFYNEEMSKKILKDMIIEKALRNGIENNYFYLQYQPQVNIQGEIIGVESLVRLKNEELGFVSPGEFIPIAEKTGLIITIGDWIMETAIIKKLEWFNNGYGDIRVSINVSSLQIHRPDFVEKIKKLVEKYKINPNFIELEITESVLMEQLDKNVVILQELRDIGIRIALDDFGTGYSSLNYLRTIPLNTVKIDKSFIDDICINDKQGAIVDSIIEMAHKLGMEVVAEGIETIDQLIVMKEKNCDIIQGYVYSRPLLSTDLERLLKKGLDNLIK